MRTTNELKKKHAYPGNIDLREDRTRSGNQPETDNQTEGQTTYRHSQIKRA